MTILTYIILFILTCLTIPKIYLTLYGIITFFLFEKEKYFYLFVLIISYLLNQHVNHIFIISLFFSILHLIIRRFNFENKIIIYNFITFFANFIYLNLEQETNLIILLITSSIFLILSLVFFKWHFSSQFYMTSFIFYAYLGAIISYNEHIFLIYAVIVIYYYHKTDDNLKLIFTILASITMFYFKTPSYYLILLFLNPLNKKTYITTLIIISFNHFFIDYDLIKYLIYILFVTITFLYKVDIYKIHNPDKNIQQALKTYALNISSSTNFSDMINLMTKDVCSNCSKYQTCLNTKHHYLQYLTSILENKANNKCIHFTELKQYTLHYDNQTVSFKKNLLYLSTLTYSQDKGLINYSKLIIYLVTNHYNIEKYIIHNYDYLHLTLFLKSFLPIDKIKLETILKTYLKYDILLKINKNKTQYEIEVIKNFSLKISYESSSLAKENNLIKGDNYKVFDKGRFTYIALADGMGSGIKAYNESYQLIKTIANLIEIEIDHLKIIPLINNMLSINKNFDSYSTLDFLIIDKEKHKGYLYKLGSATSYVINNNLKAYENKYLAVGLNDDISYYLIDLHEDDLIVLSSDGLTEHLSSSLLEKTLLENKESTLNKLIFNTLKVLLKENNNKFDDDISLLCIKIGGRNA